MDYCTSEMVKKLRIVNVAKRLLAQTGKTTCVRDFNLLESAIETPFQVFGGE